MDSCILSRCSIRWEGSHLFREGRFDAVSHLYFVNKWWKWIKAEWDKMAYDDCFVHSEKWQLSQSISIIQSNSQQVPFSSPMYSLYILYVLYPYNSGLKFLVRIATDLGMSEANEYASRLQKAERVNQLRQQRESDSAHGKSGSAASVHSLPIPLS